MFEVFNIGAVYYLISYAGMVISLLVKMAKKSREIGENFSMVIYIYRNRFSILSAIFMIPLSLILCENIVIISEGQVIPVLPVNEVTSVLVGINTEYIFYYLISIAYPKK